MSARQTVLETLRARKQRPVSYAQGLELKKKTGAVKYIETCAMTAAGVADAFDAAVRAARDSDGRKPRPKPFSLCTVM